MRGGSARHLTSRLRRPVRATSMESADMRFVVGLRQSSERKGKADRLQGSIRIQAGNWRSFTAVEATATNDDGVVEQSSVLVRRTCLEKTFDRAGEGVRGV